MQFISLNDLKGVKSGDEIVVKYLSLSGDIFTSRNIIFRGSFLRGDNMIVIKYNENKRDNYVNELYNIISFIKK